MRLHQQRHAGSGLQQHVGKAPGLALDVAFQRRRTLEVDALQRRAPGLHLRLERLFDSGIAAHAPRLAREQPRHVLVGLRQVSLAVAPFGERGHQFHVRPFAEDHAGQRDVLARQLVHDRDEAGQDRDRYVAQQVVTAQVAHPGNLHAGRRRGESVGQQDDVFGLTGNRLELLVGFAQRRIDVGVSGRDNLADRLNHLILVFDLFDLDGPLEVVIKRQHSEEIVFFQESQRRFRRLLRQIHLGPGHTARTVEDNDHCNRLPFLVRIEGHGKNLFKC